MRLPVFVVGLLLSIAASVGIGMFAGFETGQLILFVIAVTVVLQLAYVVVVALLAAERARKTQGDTEKEPNVASSAAPETDV